MRQRKTKSCSRSRRLLRVCNYTCIGIEATEELDDELSEQVGNNTFSLEIIELA